MADIPDTDFHISTRVMVLKAGMYILRLLAQRPAPESCLTVQQSPLGRGAVDFFPAEGVMRNTLSAPGDCIVVRVKGTQAGLLVTEIHKKGTERVRLMVDRIVTGAELTTQEGTQVASVPVATEAAKVEPVQQSQPAEVRLTAAPSADVLSFRPEASNTPEALRVTQLGHIERKGDVTVTNAWLGDPSSGHRLEGFALHCENMPEGLNLAYSCRSGAGAEPQIGLAGHFVGTRRQAKPITAVAFVLSGPRANDFELSGNVAFAGLPPLAIVPGQELSGPSGTEPLVALQLTITPKASQAVPPASPWNDAAAVRTFSAARL